MRLQGPGEQAMVAGAVARARAAGVPEEMIQHVIQQETAGRAGYNPALVAGRIDALARQRRQAAGGE
jgi:hypothetical protein